MYMTEHLMRFVLTVAQMENELLYVLSSDLGIIENDTNAFIDWLEGYRRLSTTRPAVGILRQLRHDDRCACRDTSAFLFLYESARNYKGAGFVSLYTFLRYFERKLESNAPVRADKADGDGRVSIMTIHKSKGLEFPVCFVARCGQTFSAKSQIKDLIFDKRTGVAMKLFCQKDAFKRQGAFEELLLEVICFDPCDDSPNGNQANRKDD